ncbi:hypothetical protein [Chloroflexus aggregans]|uniref:Uncharacterized protein n=1 Tax=Chloroflexus aggregans (strain MD-66 / DSM 9485) TaxID=326427 RepID=B8GAF5_CHLAD|nr:hypothetical protein [Chloroflexus aggregans]ACL26530.1 conserved hypothetical protein [Chloroflexus aggregans DSM 9485]
MSDNERTVQYTCLKCGYKNSWTRDEILQRGKEVIYRGEHEVIYSLRCKNPAGCPQRMRIALKRVEK